MDRELSHMTPERGASLSPREERVGREPVRGVLQKTQDLLSPALSSLLRREEREKPSTFGSGIPGANAVSEDSLSDDDQLIEPVEFSFGLKRRTFVQLLATGLVIATAPISSFSQERGGRRSGGGSGGDAARNLGRRIHIGKDGVVTVLTGKVEMGQGSRAELSQAAAEELRVPVGQIQLVMSDTGLTPNDGNTAGSASTPRTVPAIRQAAAAAREVLCALASQRWNVERPTVELRDGKLTHGATNRTLTFAELAQGDDLPKALEKAAPAGSALAEVKEWKVLGTSVPRPNARDLVTGGASLSFRHPTPWHVARESAAGNVLRREARRD